MTAAERYQHQLYQLQPPGNALPDEADSNWMQLLLGIAQEFARIDGRCLVLEREITLQDGTTEILDWWERALGLPDPCAPEGTSDAERLAAIRGRMKGRGGVRNRQWFIDLADQYGIGISITEEAPCLFGADDFGAASFGGYDKYFIWHIYCDRAPEQVIETIFRCAIDALKPAHTHVTIHYQSTLLLENEGVLLLESGGGLLTE